ncbi:MAG TPA: 50S ribosome-binding GTPase [Candidatus Avacidaminococcus intestinavium]|uniref:50S ribosome-binding GTPase n=1 Tax=Candidatus Avacidaminococcus intestinavium TaxID=2840684 RepID=A0A9D1SL67_9FIRM|nr:50S ribosome-binding GTPase [Candidatus Avacidaminococcus intestinavium]
MSILSDYENLKKECEDIENEKVRIALFGQPGAGKSSLINAIIGQDIAKVGQQVDTTMQAETYEYNGLVFVDLPGYDTSNFPADKFFEQFKVEEFDLFLCVFSGKFHEEDTTFFRRLREQGKVCLFIRSKADDLWQPGKSIEELKKDIIQDVQKQLAEQVEVFFTSQRTMEGISELNERLFRSLEAVSAAKKERFARAFKARTEEHLNLKKEICKKMVTRYSGLAAANAINPIPGIDISLDIGIIYKLFSQVRDTYGLEKGQIEKLAPFLPVANNVLKYAVNEGIAALLKQYAGKQMMRGISKYVPIVGQGIAASMGFAMVKLAGNAYVEECHKLAMEIFSSK